MGFYALECRELSFYLEGWINVHHQRVSGREGYRMGFTSSLGLFAGQHPLPGNT